MLILVVILLLLLIIMMVMMIMIMIMMTIMIMIHIIIITIILITGEVGQEPCDPVLHQRPDLEERALLLLGASLKWACKQFVYIS